MTFELDADAAIRREAAETLARDVAPAAAMARSTASRVSTAEACPVQGITDLERHGTHAQDVFDSHAVPKLFG